MTRLFDPAVMGRYNLAYSLAEMPVINIAEQIGEVLMPSFSRMEDAQRKRAVVRSATLLQVVVAPLGVGLGAVASTVVPTLFDAALGADGADARDPQRHDGVPPDDVGRDRIPPSRAADAARHVLELLPRGVVLSLVALGGYLGDPQWACVGGCIGYALHSVVTIVAAGWVCQVLDQRLSDRRRASAAAVHPDVLRSCVGLQAPDARARPQRACRS